jgi:YD repeat-containing protein
MSEAGLNRIEEKNMSSEFNDNGTVKSITSKQRTPEQEWRIVYEEIFEYNENNEIIAIHKSEHTNKKSYYTIDYQYDERGNCIVQTVFDVVNNVLDTKTEYGYDANNNLISALKYRWLDSWMERQKVEYKYDMNKNRIMDIFYTYISWKQVWEDKHKIVYVYDDNNRIIKSSVFDWNIVRRDWDTGSKTEYSYDEFGNIASLNNFRIGNDPREWALHEPVTFFNANTHSSKKGEILVYFDAGSGRVINILGAAGAKITVVDTKGYIYYVRGNVGNFETIPTLTLPNIVFVNVERDGTRLTRTIIK